MSRNKTKVSRMLGYSALAALLGIGLMVGEASARITLATQNTAPQGDVAAPFPATNLDLDGTLAGVQVFKTFITDNDNALVRVVLNAECSIAGSPTTWLDSTIFINPAGAAPEFAVPPSNSDNALCSGNGTANPNDGWVSAVTQVFARIPLRGVHTVRVQVTPFPGAPWRIDDLSLVIDDDH